MKFSFKRFLSSALAAVMTASVLSVGMVSSVSAAAQSYVFADMADIMSTFDYTTAGGKIVEGLSFIAGGSTKWVGDESKGGPGVYLGGKSSEKNGRMFVVNADKGETISVKFCATSSSATGADCAIVNNQTLMNDKIVPDPDNGISAEATANGYAEETVELLAGSTGSYYIGSPKVKALIKAITVTPSAPAGTNTISGNVTYTKDAPTGIFKCGSTTFTLTDKTYSVTGLAAGTYEITYTGEDYKMNPVTVSIPEGSANKTFTQELVLEEIIHYTGVTEVNPTVTGNKSVYDFTSAKGDKLISDSASSKSATTAYSKPKDATDEECWVALSDEGAKLMDNSGDGNTGGSAQLIIPYTPKSNKITVSGEVTPTNVVGSKWKLIDLGVVALLADSSTNVAIANNNQVASEVNADKLISKQKITYSITLDLAAKTASGTVTNGSGAPVEFKDVAFAEGAEFNSIVAVTNAKESIKTGKDRALLIPSVTIVDGEEEASPVTVGSATTNGKTYVFAGVAEDHTNDAPTLVVYGSSTATDAADIKAQGHEVLSTGTVYNSVQGVDTPSGVNGKVFAQEVTGNKTINIVGVLGDYVSAVTSVTVGQ